MNKYQRTRDALLDAIYYREWQIGQALPTEPQLMVRFSVGRNTLREVIRSLTTEGIVEVIQGSGTYLRRMPGSAQATNLHQPLLPALRQHAQRDTTGYWGPVMPLAVCDPARLDEPGCRSTSTPTSQWSHRKWREPRRCVPDAGRRSLVSQQVHVH